MLTPFQPHAALSMVVLLKRGIGYPAYYPEVSGKLRPQRQLLPHQSLGAADSVLIRLAGALGL